MNVDNLICPNTTDYKIGGNVFSKEYNYIEIKLLKCKGLPICKSDAEIDAFLDTLSVGISLTNYYFDSDNYTYPVKVQFSNDNNFKVMSSLKKHKEIKIRLNDVTDLAGYLPFSQPTQYTFYSLGERLDDSTNLNPSGEFFNIKLTFDDRFQVMSRSVFTLSDLIGLVGGINSIMFIVGAWCIGILIDRIYISSLISSLYHVPNTLSGSDYSRKVEPRKKKINVNESSIYGLKNSSTSNQFKMSLPTEEVQ
eukprot:CAMPEP_0168356186 /NCGR_PEP_ID=MMETSP0213-20121227/25008_1 /TAXON_ID=151035 /ORGANISM="Euplotes harpa, Strain FSP1.4" /LENGTH=250 /DNA_ID=CAMNT_0008368563 /DNA_START=495 /DNA_END=1244 /DNA_ORIENTATION=+